MTWVRHPEGRIGDGNKLDNGCGIHSIRDGGLDVREVVARMKDNCPLCDGELKSLRHTEDYVKTGFHYRCTKCNHGWYFGDLWSFDYKDPVKVRELILKKDKEKEDA